MEKDKLINFPALLISLVCCAVAFIISEIVCSRIDSFILRSGVFVLLAAIFRGAAIMLSESFASGGYVKRWREVFYKDSIKAWLIAIPVAFALGAGAQFAYRLAEVNFFSSGTEFKGAVLVCDISGSMNENDPQKEAVQSIKNYIQNIDLGEKLGIITYSDFFTVFREYSDISTKQEQEEIVQRLDNEIQYGGMTDTQSALNEALTEIKNSGEEGLVILFSDGISQIDINLIKEQATFANAKNGIIPINTICYSADISAQQQMESIAQITGGQFSYIEKGQSVAESFSDSRQSSEEEKLYLFNKTNGERQNYPVRIILQIILVFIICSALSYLVVAMLDNKQLLKHYILPALLFSMVIAVAFAMIMIGIPDNTQFLARIIIYVAMIVLFIPTYRMYS